MIQLDIHDIICPPTRFNDINLCTTVNFKMDSKGKQQVVKTLIAHKKQHCSAGDQNQSPKKVKNNTVFMTLNSISVRPKYH